ncbi:MAG: hypothetical protein ACHP7C_10225, partial [Lysobacterales bacterium]
MITLYLALLTAGIGLFVLSYVAQFRLASLLRQRYPQQWKIIAEPEQGKATAFRIWIRMQHALRSPALPALGDAAINRCVKLCRIQSDGLGIIGQFCMKLIDAQRCPFALMSKQL